MSDLYLKYQRKVILDFDEKYIESLYNQGFLFGRVEKGQMDETRSLRINLESFELSSENRRVLRKVESLEFNCLKLPIEQNEYDWKIHKLGKDFYAKKFDDVSFSANKIKELVTSNHNFNFIFEFKLNKQKIGYAICYVSNNIIHYCYPFYDLEIDTRNLGMGMMLNAIVWAKNNHKKYIYLGSVQRESDKYKMQFKGLEMWDNENQKWTVL